MRRLILIFLLLALAFSLPASAESTNPDEIYNFAQYLKQKGEYYRAITEFERFRFLFPQESRGETALEQIIACYFQARQYEKAAQECETYLDSYPASPQRPAILMKMAESYYATGKYSEGAGELELFLANHPADKLKPEILQLIGLCYLKDHKWPEASAAFTQLAALQESPSGPSAQAAVLELSKVKDLPHRYPMVAGTLSAILPGAGQLYAGRAGDAVASLSVNAFFTYVTVVAFKEKQPVVGGLLALVELGWYSGNIYSAANAAHKYNQRQEKALIQQITDHFTPLISTRDKGSYGITWAYAF